MNCDKYLELMQRDLDGELSEIEQKMLQKHIDQCPSCKEEYSALRRVIGLFEDAELVEPPLTLKHLIMAEVRKLEIEGIEPMAEPSTERILPNIKHSQPAISTAAVPDALKESKPVRKKGIGLLVVVAIINTFFFCYWVLPFIGFNTKGSNQSVVLTQMTMESFSKFALVGQHTGDIVQVILKSVVGIMPWNWILIYLSIAVVLLVIMWTVARKKGGSLA